MIQQDLEHRVTILLKVIGSAQSESVLAGLTPERQTSLRERMSRLETEPPTDAEVLEVLREFDRFVRFATKSDTAGDGDSEKNTADIPAARTNITIIAG